jgi:ribosome-associated protein
MMEITPGHFLDEDELRFRYVHASGPGGQNVNKVATAVQLRFNIESSSAFNETEKARLLQRLRSRLTKEGDLIIHANRYRTQEGNRNDAVHRLGDLLQEALRKPIKRRKTKPSRAAVEKRLDGKRRQANKKNQRKINKNLD